MRNLSKLILFFSLSFIIIFAAAACIKFLSLRVEWAKSLPPKPETAATLFLAAAHWALSLSFFTTIILSINYAIRKNYFKLVSITCVMALSFLFSFGFSFILEQLKTVPPTQSSGVPLGDKGLILTNELSRNETAIVLLNGTAQPYGPRVIAIPGQPLTFQTTTQQWSGDLPPIPFRDNTPWFLKSLSIDLRLNAQTFQSKFTDGFFLYLIYVGALIFMLCSLAYNINFSAWSLANLFLAVLAFRGILALNTFLNSNDMQEIAGPFLNNFISMTIALPLFFLGIGLLLNIYSLLSFASKRRHDDDF